MKKTEVIIIKKIKDKLNRKRYGGTYLVECNFCGKIFKEPVSHIKDGHGKFCSSKCQYQWQSKNLIGKDNPRWSRVTLICKICGKPYYIKPSHLKKYNSLTCSRKCDAIFKKTRYSGKCNPSWKGGGGIIACLNCKKEMIVNKYYFFNKKFCSQQCKAEYQSKIGRVKVKCYLCKKEISIPRNRLKSKPYIFCNKYCKGIYMNRYMLSLIKKPTKPEQKLIKLINKHNLPFKYVGNGKFWIENINPDFIDGNGKKICIEMFGDYWHNPFKLIGLKWSATEKGRKEILAKYGWKCLIIWESELKNEKKVLNKIESFI